MALNNMTVALTQVTNSTGEGKATFLIRLSLAPGKEYDPVYPEL